MDKEAIKKFYFSGASKFSFPSRKTQHSTASNMNNTNETKSRSVIDVDVSSVDVNAANCDLPGSASEQCINKEDTMMDIRVGPTNHSLVLTNRSNCISSIEKSISGVLLSTSGVPVAAGHMNAIRLIAHQNLLTSRGGSGNDDDLSDVSRCSTTFHSSLIRKLNNNKDTKKGKKPHTTHPDTVSPEYFAFFRKQQELSKDHNRIDKSIQLFEKNRQEHQEDIQKTRMHCLELLHDIEMNSDWKLHSKYDTSQLIKDCDLSLQSVELVNDKEPDTSSVTAVIDNLNNIREQYEDSPAFSPYNQMVQKTISQLELLQLSLKEGNCDFTNLAHITDTLLQHLKSNCEFLSIEALIREQQIKITNYSAHVEDMFVSRKAAMEDGEVNIAEKLCYDIIDKYESLVAEVISKARTLDEAFEDTVAITELQQEHHKATAFPLESIRGLQSKLRTRCQSDINKMTALRKRIEEVESATRAKASKDRQESDKKLNFNEERLVAIYNKMSELEDEMKKLEKERNREFKRRLIEKEKEEHRKAEYAKFCEVIDSHMGFLKITVKNADIITHSTDVIQGVVDNGFTNIADELSGRSKLLKDARVDTHKEHLEVFRALLVELGEIIYRKERMIEEIDKKIQQAHIQQELLAETFNPKARKFGDMKKTLLSSRDELKEDIEHLKCRADKALSGFQYSEEALHLAGVAFIHPLTNQEHHTLAMKAKMIEYKAIMAGHYRGNSVLMEEIAELQHDVTCAKEAMDSFNTSTMGTVNRSFPSANAASQQEM